MRRSSPQARYALCAGALIVMVVLPIVTTTRRYSRTTVPESTVASLSHLVVAGSDDDAEFVDSGTRGTPVRTMIAPWILPVWSLGVLALSLRLLLGGIEVRTLRRSGQPVDDGLSALAARLMPRMGVNRHVILVRRKPRRRTRAEGREAVPPAECGFAAPRSPCSPRCSTRCSPAGCGSHRYQESLRHRPAVMEPWPAAAGPVGRPRPGAAA